MLIEKMMSPDELGGFAEVFERYGFGTICCVVLIFGIFWFVKQNTKTQDRLWSKLDELSKTSDTRDNGEKPMTREELKHFIEEIVHAETAKVFKDETRKNVDILSNYNKISKAIRPMLLKAKDDFDADRISVYVFHNGTHSSHGLPFYKYTCIQEIVRREKQVTPRIAEQQGVPLSVMDELSSTSINEDGGFVIDDLVSLEYAFPMAIARLKRDGFNAAVAVSVYNENSETVGFVYLTFLDKKTKEELLSIKERVGDRAMSLSSVMDFNEHREDILSGN